MKYDEGILWTAVIKRAIKDAVGKNTKLKGEAIEWLNSESFETVCELANLSSKRMKNMLYGGFMSQGRKEIKALLVDNIKECVSYLLPGGNFYRDKTYVGSLDGDTITVKIVGKETGDWRNFTEGTSGNIVDLWTLVEGNIDSARKWLDAKSQEVKEVVKNEKRALSVEQYLSDQSPMPKDTIGPKILTPGGLLVIGGTPKVGKSSFLLSLLVHMAAGVSFLNMKSIRPLKILYLHEMGHNEMRRRLQKLKIDQKLMDLVNKNLVITSEIKITLNDEGVEMIKDIIVEKFGTKMIDLIAIDSLTTHLMTLSLLQSGIEKLRSITHPAIGIIITHLTKKVSTTILEKNPFQALVGANALRSFYTSGIVMFRPNINENILQVVYEFGNRKPISKKFISRTEGCWKTFKVEAIA